MSTVDADSRGVAAVHKLFADAGWYFREQTGPDEGIDALAEAPTSADRPSGRLIALQIKTGPSHLHPIVGGFRVSLKSHNLRYWARYSVPVVLTAHVLEQELTYWREISPDTVIKTKGGGYAIDIPVGSQLRAGAFDVLRELADARLPSSPEDLEQALRGRRAEVDSMWIDMIDGGAQVTLDAVEKVGSGRAALNLVSRIGQTDRQLDAREWSFHPERPFFDELKSLYPWATFENDRALYWREAYPAFLESEAQWDKDAAQFLWNDGADYRDWFEDNVGRAPMPYGTRASTGERLWRLKLTLNQLGRETLEAERQADYEAAMEAFGLRDGEAEAAVARSDGYYHSDVVEAPLQEPLDAVVFASPADSDYIAVERGLLADSRRVAEVIIRDATDIEPLASHIDAFLARFGEDLEIGDWYIRFTEFEEWQLDIDPGPAY